MIDANPTPVLPITLPKEAIDPDAISVCERLQKAGYVAYLVGGCVRDILIDRMPKDFDIGTDATPREVRRLFRNSRVIGRRFKLAHVYFGTKIFEVATFRGGEQLHANGEDRDGEVGSEDSVDPLIVRANNFGTPVQDAYSRDFTINALFYDPVAEQVIDHVGGYEDLKAQLVRTVGEPILRFQEDPVRILRGIKFATRLSIEVEPDTWKAMHVVAQDIQRCAIPRVTEELYRLAESRHAEPAFRMLYESGVLAVMAPEIAAHADEHGDAFFMALRGLDDLGRAHGDLPRPFVITVLYYPLAWAYLMAEDLVPSARWGDAVETWFRPMGVRRSIPVRHRACMRSIFSLLGRFFEPTTPPKGRRRRQRRPGQRELAALPQALTLLRLHHRLHGDCEDVYEVWRERAEHHKLGWGPLVVEDTRVAKERKPREGRSRRGSHRRARRSQIDG